MTNIKNKILNIKICPEGIFASLRERPAAGIYYKKFIPIYRDSIIFIFSFLFLIFFTGCSGYTNQSLYSDEVRTVYVEMFDNTTFYRDLEYTLTDAIAKRVETDTPYKIVSNRNTADTILSGKIVSMGSSALTLDRNTGRSLENLAEVTARFSWKNLKTGQYIVQDSSATSSWGYSSFQGQSFDNASKVAANKLAERIVEQMQVGW
ncbi:MAG: LPS assembly lipoprotein LptE [Planctomycetaceae bacterium]|nr:LPS assembly lipoprotein LptE [Planctomycetaceae bacterium]